MERRLFPDSSVQGERKGRQGGDVEKGEREEDGPLREVVDVVQDGDDKERRLFDDVNRRENDARRQESTASRSQRCDGDVRNAESEFAPRCPNC